jgi:hypothetical protein
VIGYECQFFTENTHSQSQKINTFNRLNRGKKSKNNKILEQISFPLNTVYKYFEIKGLFIEGLR